MFQLRQGNEIEIDDGIDDLENIVTDEGVPADELALHYPQKEVEADEAVGKNQ
jgi:hypothetical protein